MNDLHRDLMVEFVADIISEAEAYKCLLHHHLNIEAIQILDNTDVTKGLKKIKLFESVK